MAIRNLKACQNRLRKFLGGAPPVHAQPPPPKDPMTVLIESVLEADAPRRAAAAACQALLQDYVDLNELRVATPREMADCWPKDFPGAAEKGESLSRALNAIFDRTYQMSLAHLEEMPRRELRAHLLGLGLSPYAAARLLLYHFHLLAVPVDSSLVEAMEMEALVPRGATVEEVGGILDRLVTPRGAPAAHAFLRSYVERSFPALAHKRRKEARAAARQERLAEEARAKAEAQARAQAQAQELAKAQAKARSRARKPDAPKASAASSCPPGKKK